MSTSKMCRVQLDAASFLLVSATLSLEEIGALTILATVAAGSGGMLTCGDNGMPTTRALGEHTERLWPRICSFFIRDGCALYLDPTCPCTSPGSARARKPAASAEPSWEIPSGLETAWSEWIRYRREDKKIPVTHRAGEMQLKKLNAWGTKRAIAAIENSIAGQYQGLFEPRESDNRRPAQVSSSRYVPPARPTHKLEPINLEGAELLRNWRPPADAVLH
jgi:hypothetical protein